MYLFCDLAKLGRELTGSTHVVSSQVTRDNGICAVQNNR